MTESGGPAAVDLEAEDPFQFRVGLGDHVPDAEVEAALASGDLGFLHSFTTGSTVDGPGVRLVAWTTGCNWRCRYCHNPDTWKLKNGIPVTVARATEQLRKYRNGLRAMAGGLTISGGEALVQDRFVVKLFQAAKGMGIHTALDTNGSLGQRLSDGELECVDLVLLDLKGWDADRHRELTGQDPGPTREFARRLAARGRPLWVRFVLIPGYTDDFDDIERIAGFTAELGVVERVDVLPFHQMGRYKWQKLGRDYPLATVEPPAADAVERACEIFRRHGLRAP